MPPSDRELQHWNEIIQRNRAAIAAYAEALRRYRALLEACHEFSVRDLLKQLDSILPELYLASRRLPDVDDWYLDDGDDDEDSDGDEVELYELPDNYRPCPFDLLRALHQKFWFADFSWEVFDPYWHLQGRSRRPSDWEPIPASLSDHLATIYDEADWLRAYETDSLLDVRQAASHWREETDGISAGEAITGAMRAVQSLLYGHQELWEDHDTYWEPLA